MFILKGHTIKHRAFRDIAIKVTTAIYGHHGDVIVFGKLINHGYKRAQVIDNEERCFRISKENHDNWIIMQNAQEAQPYVRGA